MRPQGRLTKVGEHVHEGVDDVAVPCVRQELAHEEATEEELITEHDDEHVGLEHHEIL